MYKNLILPAMLILACWGIVAPAAWAQSSLEELAKKQISEKTGLDPNQLAVLFVNSESNQFILAFALINEKMMQSSLKAEIKQAVAPFVGQKALLALVAPTQVSTFDPFQIYFSQNNIRYQFGSITPITSDFAAGQLPPQAVSAGIISLNANLDITKNFKIFYGALSTTFSLTGQQESSGGALSNIFIFLQIIFFQILLIFLIPFLIGI
jgi:hypothetical protein